MLIEKVKDYNRNQINKWHEATKAWKPSTGGFPNLCFYTFSTPEGNHRVRGYVIHKENAVYFRLTKKEVLALTA
jgi:hypothetical protein